ncbi:MAG: LamG domain-containing protein, partial [Bacteroidota bacterium]
MSMPTPLPNSNAREFTIEMWIKSDLPAVTNSYKRILYGGNFALVEGGGTLRWLSPNGTWNDSGIDLLDGVWHHVAFVKSPTEVRIYLDGQEAYALAHNFSYNLDGTWRMGYRQNTNENWQGWIDDLRFWNMTRSTNQIQENRFQTLPIDPLNMVAHYTFDKEMSDDVQDRAGNADATLSAPNNGVKPNYTDSDRSIGRSLYFDGNDDRVTVAHPLSGNSDFTIELFFKQKSGVTNSRSRLIGASSFEFEIATNSNGHLSFYNGSAWYDNNSNPAVTDLWHHLIFIRNGNKHQLYLDGNLIMDLNLATSYNFTNKDLIIGNRYANTSQAFKGWIDEVKIWDSARGYAEIDANKCNMLSASPGLVAHYRMDQTANGELINYADFSASTATFEDIFNDNSNGPQFSEISALVQADFMLPQNETTTCTDLNTVFLNYSSADSLAFH